VVRRRSDSIVRSDKKMPINGNVLVKGLRNCSVLNIKDAAVSKPDVGRSVKTGRKWTDILYVFLFFDDVNGFDVNLKCSTTFNPRAFTIRVKNGLAVPLIVLLVLFLFRLVVSQHPVDLLET
jgi:hypothetical protein